MLNKQKIPQVIGIINKKCEQKTRKTVSKKKIINKLNYINFQDGTVLINLKHKKYNNTISLHAKLQPCHNDCLECLWVETEGLDQKLKLYEFQNFLVNDGQNVLLVRAEMKSISAKGISLILPEKCYEFSSRKVRRHSCKGIDVSLFQNSALFHGSLIDFNAVSFRVNLSTTPPQTFEWINPEVPVNVVLSDGSESLYSGECRIIRQSSSQKT
ncbi:MAG: pilus assembly protein PilZ, partial [Deltaproteobacteria bacterium]|nr:pilus assembly protein PilZ [Deltaproteobacteria bacterium]